MGRMRSGHRGRWWGLVKGFVEEVVFEPGSFSFSFSSSFKEFNWKSSFTLLCWFRCTNLDWPGVHVSLRPARLPPCSAPPSSRLPQGAGAASPARAQPFPTSVPPPACVRLRAALPSSPQPPPSPRGHDPSSASGQGPQGEAVEARYEPGSAERARLWAGASRSGPKAGRWAAGPGVGSRGRPAGPAHCGRGSSSGPGNETERLQMLCCLRALPGSSAGSRLGDEAAGALEQCRGRGCGRAG